MDWRESLRQAYESVADHPRRVFASSMGVLWGAAAIVVLLGWGTGFREFMRVELGRFGEGFVMMFPATTSSGFPGHRKGIHVRISRDDAAAAERDAGDSVRALLACHNSRERLLVESDVGQIRRRRGTSVALRPGVGEVRAAGDFRPDVGVRRELAHEHHARRPVPYSHELGAARVLSRSGPDRP